MNVVDLSKYSKKILSEHGQDGILEKIFEIIGTKTKYFVEFGSNGTRFGGGNTPYLREKYNFTGLLMDGSDNPYGIKKHKDYDVKIEFIKAENINELFAKYNVPDEFDFLSVDIDGEDYWIIHSLDFNKYKPRVISVECNWHIHPDFKLVQKHNPNYTWSGTEIAGSSSSAIMELLNKKNYTFVAYTGPDCIFVHNDEISKNNVIFENQNNPHKLGVLNGPIITTIDFQNNPFFTTDLQL
jgi:hypothetical protein